MSQLNKQPLDYLNVGCGNKFHPDWVNIDMNADNLDIISYNLLKGLPFSDGKFSVLYHSQVLEHIPKVKALDFMKECFRVLKKDGVIRVVVPDLENIVGQYKIWLNKNLESPNKVAEANYDWIMLELYDQMVRNKSGGEMAKFLQQKELINEKYILDRMGRSGFAIKSGSLVENVVKKNINNLGTIGFIKKVVRRIKNKAVGLFFGEKYRMGDFRLGGEIHMWMYDRFSLCRLMREAGFKDIKIKNARESDIQNWVVYELDIKDGIAYDPASLFVEGKK